MSARWITFADVANTTFLALRVTWMVLVVSWKAWWSGGGTVSVWPNDASRGFQSMELEYSGGTVTITVVTNAIRSGE